MLANFLEKSKPINFIVYLGLFFCFFFGKITFTLFSGDITLYQAFESILFVFLFLSVFFFFNFIVTKNKLTLDHSYAFYVFTLAITLFFSALFDFKSITLVIIYLLFLRKAYSLRSSKNMIQKIFDGGLWLGVMFLLEPFSILFSIVLCIAILAYQKITINTIISPVIGFVTPLIIYFTYLLWNNSPEKFNDLFDFISVHKLFIYRENYTLWIFGVFLFLTLLSILLKSPKALSINDYFKKSWIILIINSLIAVVFALLVNEKNGSEIIFFLIPGCIIIANGFEVVKKRILKNILFGLLLLGTIVTLYFL